MILAFHPQFKRPCKTKTKHTVYYTLPFVHKIQENINLSCILHDVNIRSYLPNPARKLDIYISYKYGPTIGQYLFNYNKVLKTLTHSRAEEIDACDCTEKYPDYVYKTHGHVHTGNLNIIENKMLHNVMRKGAKYRETPNCNKYKLTQLYKNAIDKLAVTLSRRVKNKKICFDDWSCKIMKEISIAIKKLPHEFKSCQILKQPDIVKYIEDLHDRFVIVPIDKASNNFGIVCKKFYLDTVKKELGISDEGIIGNKVYKPVHQNEEEIFQYHEKTLLQNFGIKLTDANRNIPLLYWTSKQHKNPYKFRFIAGASHCYNKQLAIELSLALKCIKTHFKNYCKVLQKRTGISVYWSVDNSFEFINKISTIKKAHSIKTFDFSTLYTNLPLEAIFKGLSSLVTKMYANSKSKSIMVNSFKKRAFWSNGSSYSGYREYTIDKLLDALHLILFNTYVQFNGINFKQILGIPMGGNASPFIADLYLSWCEYCYMVKLSKTDHSLARKLSYNCRYLDDISTVNITDFGKIARDIYDPTLILEGSTCSNKQDTFLDLFIRVINKKFVIGIYHKVDDFNFEVISFPFPESNVHTSLGPKTYYSQLIRFYRLCNNIQDFMFRARLIYWKLAKRGYEHGPLYKSFIKFCLRYDVGLKYGVTDYALFFTQVLQFNNSTSCNIKDQNMVNSIIKPCLVPIKDIYGKHKQLYKLKSCSINLKDVQQTLLREPELGCTIEKTSVEKPQGDTLGYMESPIKQVCHDTDVHLHPFGFSNPKNHCFMNAVLQALFSVIRSTLHNCQFSSNTEGVIAKTLCSAAMATSASGEVGKLKSLLAQYNSFYSGFTQEDASECLFMLLDIINQGTIGAPLVEKSHTSTLCGVSLSDSLFSFVLEKYYACDTCKLHSPSFEHGNFVNITPLHGASLQELIKQGLEILVVKSCSQCKKDTKHIGSSNFLQPPQYLIIIVNRFGNNGTTKNKTLIPLDQHIKSGQFTFDLHAVIDHHGQLLSSGHYTASVICCNDIYYCNDDKITVCNKSNIRDSQTVYIMMYKLLNNV